MNNETNFSFAENRERIEKALDKHIKLAGISDPEGFTLLEGFVAPVIFPQITDFMNLQGRLFPQVAIIGNKSGVVYYFYLDKLFPGESLD